MNRKRMAFILGTILLALFQLPGCENEPDEVNFARGGDGDDDTSSETPEEGSQMVCGWVSRTAGQSSSLQVSEAIPSLHRVEPDRQDTESSQPSPTPTTACGETGKSVYVVDVNRTLYRFDPPNLTFEEVGSLECDATSNPFSMAVNRDGIAYVLYDNGLIYRVNVGDASCNPTAYQTGQEGFSTFGMGYSTNSAGSVDETLFISESSLGTLDTNSMTITKVGPTAIWGELTGNALGELWGFYPQQEPPVLALIDKTAGDWQYKVTLDLDKGGSLSGYAAWAMAFWGGSYVLFWKSYGDPSTDVYKVSVDTCSMEKVMENTGMIIVGAGVSTCAPVDNW